MSDDKKPKPRRPAKAGHESSRKDQEVRLQEMAFAWLISTYTETVDKYGSIARDAGVTKRTAQYWFERAHMPRLTQFFLMLEHSAVLRSLMEQWLKTFKQP